MKYTAATNMLRRILISSSILTVAATFSLAQGCSSSSGNSGGSSGSSSGSSEAGDDSGSGSGSSSGSTGDDGGDATSSSSSGSGSSSGTGSSSGSSSGSMCPATTDAGTWADQTYVPAVANQGLCSMTDIQGFITACVTTPAGCGAWIQANLAGGAADGGGAGTACGNCIFTMQNNGGCWLDPNNYFGPNYAGCFQITDPTNGAGCAAAWNNLNGCEGLYCDAYQTSATNYQCCTTAVTGTGGQCNAEATAFQTKCAADLGDGGAALSCFPGTGATAQQTDLSYIINMICGGGG